MKESTPGKPMSIRMGEMAVAKTEGVLLTLLGSCVGVALYDRKHKVGGLAHIVLPQSREPVELHGKFVDTAIPALLAEMQVLVGKVVNPVAKYAGGASMFAISSTRNIGQENLEAAERLLKAMGIPIVGRDGGGTKGRRMSLEVATGIVRIEMVGCEGFEL